MVKAHQPERSPEWLSEIVRIQCHLWRCGMFAPEVLAGPQSVVSINRGRSDGLEVGHVLALYSQGGSVRDTSKATKDRDARIALPNERAGLAFVFRVFDRVSYALVMQITRPVSTLDVVQTP